MYLNYVHADCKDYNLTMPESDASAKGILLKISTKGVVQELDQGDKTLRVNLENVFSKIEDATLLSCKDDLGNFVDPKSLYFYVDNGNHVCLRSGYKTVEGFKDIFLLVVGKA